MDTGTEQLTITGHGTAVSGPRLAWHDRQGVPVPEAEPLTFAAAALRQGLIVGIKGLGGFHLAVKGADPEAIARLRLRKKRPAKPLAVMVRDLAGARRIALVGPPKNSSLPPSLRPSSSCARNAAVVLPRIWRRASTNWE